MTARRVAGLIMVALRFLRPVHPLMSSNVASHAPSRIVRTALASLALTLAACAANPPAAQHAYVDPVGLFPMAAYDQEVDHWIDPSSPTYDTPFLSPAEQRAHWAAYLARYFGTAERDPSPWNPAMAAQISSICNCAGSVAMTTRGKSVERSATVRTFDRTPRGGSTRSSAT